MLDFASEWSWITKSVTATLILAFMTIFMMFTQKQYAYGGEKFIFAWLVGVMFAFFFFGHVSKSMNTADLFNPVGVFLFVALLGFILGGVANIFIGQAIPAATNPGAVWAIIGANAPIAYLATFWLARAHPKYFPPIEFGAINFIGVILIVVGVVMVMQPATK